MIAIFVGLHMQLVLSGASIAMLVLLRILMTSDTMVIPTQIHLTVDSTELLTRHHTLRAPTPLEVTMTTTHPTPTTEGLPSLTTMMILA